MACPLCASTLTHTVQEFEVAGLIRDWKKNFHIDVRMEFGRLDKFDLCKCPRCEFLYFSPDSVAGSPALYAQLQRVGGYYMPRKWEHEMALEDLRGCSPVLEIGSGTGDFIAMARDEVGLDIEGIELNDEAVNWAQKHGRPVHLMNLSDLVGQERKYQALCSFQVLEHLSDPSDFLRMSCALLSPGGKLLLGVPNVESFLRYQRNLLDLPPHHMSRWSVHVLRRIQELFPLRMVQLKTEPLAAYHIEYYLDAYFSVAERHGLPKFVRFSPLRNGLMASLRRGAVRKFLRGQTLYVCYERI
jgi:2-polyprenyl-3-methyl-5-hydroxy-6-metoxy-1,4-benzoquinol methylase